jgi:hypothetical protein
LFKLHDGWSGVDSCVEPSGFPSSQNISTDIGEVSAVARPTPISKRKSTSCDIGTELEVAVRSFDLVHP